MGDISPSLLKAIEEAHFGPLPPMNLLGDFERNRAMRMSPCSGRSFPWYALYALFDQDVNERLYVCCLWNMPCLWLCLHFSSPHAAQADAAPHITPVTSLMAFSFYDLNPCPAAF